MISKIKNKFKSDDNKRLLSNFVSLSVLQGANYVLPLITLPYLVRVLGVEYYGLLAFVGATVAYFGVLTDYGFNLTGTREISIHREDKDKVIEIFSSVMTIKSLLMFLSLFLLAVLVFSFEKFSKDAIVYFLTFGTIIGRVLFPIWFFQGMERMKYITYINISVKLLFALSVFIFIHQQNDYYIVPLLTSVGTVISGVWSLVLIERKFDIKFKLQSLETIKCYLFDGWHVFISGLFTTLYTNSVTLVLGLFTNNTSVGYYVIAEKVVKITSSVFSSIQGAIYPYIAKLVQKSKSEALLILKKLTIYSSLAMFILSLLILTFAKYIIYLISGSYIKEAIFTLQILSFFPLIITVARIFAMNYIITFKYQKYLTKIYALSAVISFILFFLLVPLFKEYGAAITVMVVELFATTYMYIIIRRYIL